MPTLDAWRTARLLEWHGNPAPVFEDASWVEIQGCMVVSQAWSLAAGGDSELFEALRPTITLSISFSGGLRALGQGGWLDGCGPVVTIFGFHSEADVLIVRVANDEQIMDQPQRTNVPFTVSWPGPGDYRIEASCTGQTDVRLVKIVEWDQLQAASVRQLYGTKLNGVQLCGAALIEESEGAPS